jgi:hypothetical protein
MLMAARFRNARDCSAPATRKGSDIHVKISQRHNPDPGFKPLFGTDMITLTLKGAQNGDMVDFETALQAPGVAFKAVLTRIGD